jgi:anthranilate phosphoribosyltransferase
MVDFAVPCLHGHPTATPQPVVDIVGTGGDGMDTFNVSTAAGIVMAACGVTVAKHGNRSSSGKASPLTVSDSLCSLGITPVTPLILVRLRCVEHYTTL